MDYVVRVNNLKDIRGNLVVPNTEVPVARYWNTNVISPSTTWSWHARYSADTSIYQQNWFRAEYVEDPQFWFTGVGPFCGGALPAPPCGSDCETPIDYQLSPTLFRTTLFGLRTLVLRAPFGERIGGRRNGSLSQWS
ncbi:MAG: hypothetical protein IPK15_04005 [Verrucomicrobia bacterium]|nr:hypothetical protein [Verrucomicrobiota bacterium]